MKINPTKDQYIPNIILNIKIHPYVSLLGVKIIKLVAHIFNEYGRDTVTRKFAKVLGYCSNTGLTGSSYMNYEV